MVGNIADGGGGGKSGKEADVAARLDNEIGCGTNGCGVAEYIVSNSHFF